jgi:hypothetical protein
MFEEFGRWIPGFDPATGILALPPWAVAAGAVLLAFVGLFVLTRCLFALARYLLTFIRYLRSVSPRAGRVGSVGVAVSVVLVLFGAALAWFVLDGWS